MTSRERIIQVFDGKIPDKVPVTPRLDTKWFNNAGEEYTEKIIDKLDSYLYVDVLPDFILYFGEYARKNLETNTSGDLRKETIHTPKGPITRVLHLEKSMMDWATEHFFKSPEDIEKALSIPFEPAEPDLSEYNEWNDRIGDNGIVSVGYHNALCCPGLWLSPEDFLMYACCYHTDLVKEVLAKVTDNLIVYAQSCLDAGIRHFLVSGGELCSQTLMGPEWFSQLITPYDGKMIKYARERGGYIWYHSHGKLSKVIEMMADLGAHVISPVEKPPQGDITLPELKKLVGGKVTLAGNLDDQTVLATGDRDLIIREAKECLEAGMPGGRYLLGGTEGCVFSPENAEGYLLMTEIRDQYGVY